MMTKNDLLITIFLSVILLTFQAKPLAAQIDVSVNSFENIESNQCPGYSDVFVTLKNHSNETLYQVDIIWYLIDNYAQRDTIHWSGTLLPGAISEPVLLSYYHFEHFQRHWFVAKTNQPNGSTDSYPNNDSKSKIADVSSCHNNDATILNLVEEYEMCPDQHPILVSLQNLGLDTLETATINYSINNLIQSPFYWTGFLAPNEIIENINIGTHDLSEGAYDISVWVSQTNGIEDEVSENDSLSLNNINISSKTIYRVGSSDTCDYETIGEVADHLSEISICNPLTVLIEDGIYEESIIIQHVDGASETNTITYTSESQDSTAVTIKYYYNDPISSILLDSASHIIIKNIYFNTNGRTGIRFTNHSHHNVVSNNKYYGGTSINSNNSFVFINDSLCHHNKIRHNNIQNGAYGVYVVGFENTTSSDEISITNNYFNSQKEKSIYLNYVSNPSVDKNTFYSSNQNIESLHVNNCNNGFRISNNNFKSLNGTIRLTSCSNPENKKGKIFNNLIHTYCYINNSSYIDFQNNTISPNTNYSIISLNTISNLDFVNNIIINPNGYVFNLNDSEVAFSRCDHNIYYTNGDFASDTPYDYPANSFSAWQQSYNRDAHSYFYNPTFQAYNDLHIKLTSDNYMINDKGLYIPDILTDYDGNIRDSSNPDIGAFTFEIPKYDIGLNPLYFEEMGCVGLKEVLISFTNYGDSIIDQAIFKWSVNGSEQNPHHWTGNITHEAETERFTLGTVDFQVDSLYNITVWLDSIVNHTDGLAENNTYSETFTTQAMSGTYSVGDSSRDFLSLQQAIDTLTLRGICSSVILELKDTTYSQGTVISYIPGTSDANTLTIQSESRDSSICIIKDQHSEAFTLDSAQHIIIQNICINGLYSWHNGILINNKSNHITIQNNYFYKCDESISTDYSTNNHNHVKNNFFLNCNLGISFTSSEILSEGTVIRENIISSCKQGIYLYKEDSPILEKNTIQKYTVSYNYDYNAIKLKNCYNNLQINANSMVIIDGNALSLEKCKLLTAETALISNNMITGSIKLEDNKDLSFYNNTIKTFNESSGGLFAEDNENIILKNNIFNNTSGGQLLHLRNNINFLLDYNCYYNTGDVFGKITESTSGTYNVSQISNLEDWQNIRNSDFNSIVSNPEFINDTNNLHIVDAYPIYQSGEYIPEISVDIDGETRFNPPSIGADKFIQPIYSNDAYIKLIYDPDLCAGENDLTINLKNIGSNTIHELDLAININDSLLPVYNWTGSLNPNEAQDIVIGSYGFDAMEIINIKSWIDAVNGGLDNNNLNDTFAINYLLPRFNGTYTIGEAGDFTSINDAVDVLHRNGICGAVTFNILPGVYDEEFEINEIEGVDSISTITFQSLLLDSASVNIRTSPWDYILKVNNSNYITFKNLSFTTNGMYGLGVAFFENSNHCALIDNHFSCYNRTGSDQYYFAKFLECDSSLIQGNSMENSVYKAILLDSENYPTGSNGNKIIDNRILNSRISSISCEKQNHLLIKNNYIKVDEEANEANTGISISSSGSTIGLEIRSNKIHGNISTLMYLNFIHPSLEHPTKTFLIANNELIQSSSSRGFSFHSCRNINLINNSCLLSGNSLLNGKNLYLDFCSNLNLINNNFVNQADGYTISNFNSSFTSSNYNNYYTSGPVLINESTSFESIDYETLEAYQLAYDIDNNSFSKDPLFYGPYQLLPLSATFDALGTPHSEVLTDINNEARNLTHPDIGAYEFDIHNLDIGILGFSDSDFSCDAEPNIRIDFRNFGTDPVSNVTFGWSINDNIQASQTWNGSLAFSDTLALFQIGTYDFMPGQSYALKIWIEGINSTLDENNINDSLSLSPLYTSLSGTYFIGGSDSDFLSISDAIQALSLGGVCDSVVMKIRPGVYTEQLEIPNIQGASSTKHITFESEFLNADDVTIIYNASIDSNYTILLKNTHHLKFKHLTIGTNLNTASSAIQIGNNVNHILFEGNKLKGDDANSESFQSLINALEDEASDLVFINNTFEGGYFGLEIGDSFSDIPKQITIYQNTFLNQRGSAIYLPKSEAITILKNTILSNINSSSSTCINVHGNHGSLQIEQNKIDIVSGHGIRVSSSEATDPYGSISNNMIAIRGGTIALTGIHTYTSYCNVTNNSVLILNNNTQSKALYIGTPTVYVSNNSFVNKGGGLAVDIQTYSASLEYNNFYTTGLYVGKVISNSYESIQDHNLLNAFSISEDPLYLSADDLHISNNSPLINAGSLNTNLDSNFDYDDQLRDNIVDIGADEFDLSQLKAEVFNFGFTSPPCIGEHEIKASIRNTGTTEIHALILHYSINGIEMDTTQWTGLLLTGDSANNINLGSYYFNSGVYDLQCWVSLIFDNSETIDSIYSWQANIHTAPIVNLGEDTTVCNYDLFILNSGGGFSEYLWMNLDEENILASDSAITINETGLYYIQVTDSNSCQVTDTISVQIFPDANIELPYDSLFMCYGSEKTITLDENEDFQYIWTDIIENTMISTNHFAVLDTFGTFSVQIENLCGLTDTDTFLIAEATPNQLILQDDVNVDLGEFVLIILGTPDTYENYIWNTGQTSNSIIVETLNLPIGTYTYILEVEDSNGCFISDTVNVNVGTVSIDTHTACESFVWIDGNTYTESNNTATYILDNTAGGDSIVTLNLTISHNSNTGTDIQTACESFDWIDGNTYTADNHTATFTLTNSAGCDSIVTLDLTLLNNTGTDIQTACESFNWIDGNTYTEDNHTATFTLTNIAGCDSVVTLDLTLLNYTGTDIQTACESFDWIDGNTYTEDNHTATFTITNSVGCDSVITLDLTLLNNTGTDIQTACESFEWIDGNTYIEDNHTATYTLINSAGCDSIVTLDLVIIDLDTSLSVNNETIISNQEAVQYQWLNCDDNYAVIEGENNALFTASSNGNYALELTQDFCIDTSLCVSITTVGIIENPLSNKIKIYPNPTYGNVKIDFGKIKNPRLSIYTLKGQIIIDDLQIEGSNYAFKLTEPAGIYFIEISIGSEKEIFKIEKL